MLGALTRMASGAISKTSRRSLVAAGDHALRTTRRLLTPHASPVGVSMSQPGATTPAGPQTGRSPVATAALQTPAAGSMCEPDGYESGLIRGASIKFSDSATLRLRRRADLQWQAGVPSRVLIVKKPKNPEASTKLGEIGAWLQARGIEVFVERAVWATEFPEFTVFDPHVNADVIDFCITLGGDGTVLYMTSLFEQPFDSCSDQRQPSSCCTPVRKAMCALRTGPFVVPTSFVTAY
ncbi:hypothetical protein TSOC_000443 [Tetrabaena socialis]|uniref:NAD kinase 2, chloroplastic n=1 Tax=Tetrabaena socialis TaxID=47790 RepID=A0A2J8AJD4_9CHLO|nr:hypothetical protein TSOC_000443 [Tetrabaena socialis]|eukprot:PNH12625.1 hypothetical protein TSOC_000443 [Tetrabaena socialis]